MEQYSTTKAALKQREYHLIPDIRSQMSFGEHCTYLAEVSASLLYATELGSKVNPPILPKKIFLTTEDTKLVTEINQRLKGKYPNHWYVASDREGWFELVKHG